MRGILTWHSIDESGSVVSTSPERFSEQLAWLAAAELRVVAVDELLQVSSHEDALALTFDDGYRNFAAHAWPRLRDHGFPASLFIVTARVGGSNDWESGPAGTVPSLPLLNWEVVARMAEEGLDLGSHTRTHPRLSGLDPGRLRDEVEGSRDELLSRTGVRPAGLAYPYGALDGPAVEATRRHYAWAVTADLRVVDGSVDPYRIPRLDAFYFRRPGSLKAWGTEWLRCRLGLRRLGRRVRTLGLERRP